MLRKNSNVKKGKVQTLFWKNKHITEFLMEHTLLCGVAIDERSFSTLKRANINFFSTIGKGCVKSYV